MPFLFIRAIWNLRHDTQFTSLAALATFAVTVGTVFYTLVEGLRLIDAFYFSVTTLTTVGYGDFSPQTDAGKLFTAVYVLIGVGILLSFVTKVAGRAVQDRADHRATQGRPSVRREHRAGRPAQRAPVGKPH